MATTADLRVGAVCKFNGELCVILESEHRTPGNLRAFYQVKMRNIKSGKLIENRFRSGEGIEFVRVERSTYSYLYNDGHSYYFMNVENYDQVPVDGTIVGDSYKFLKESQRSSDCVRRHKYYLCRIAITRNLRVESTEPGLKRRYCNKRA